MIGDLIGNYGDVGALTILVGLMVWYLKYQTKRQAEREDKHDEERIKKENKRDEERKEGMLFNRNLLINDIKELHKDSLKNADLNNQSLILQKNMIKQVEEHNGHSKKAWEKTIESLSVICNKLNNINSTKEKSDDD